jgi:hypothetical protein
VTNRTAATILLTAMTLGAGVAVKTSADIMRPERPPRTLVDRRLDEMPEFIVTELHNGTDEAGRFTHRRILTAGGLACDLTTYATSAYVPSTCEVDTPIPDPRRFVSLAPPSER